MGCMQQVELVGGGVVTLGLTLRLRLTFPAVVR